MKNTIRERESWIDHSKVVWSEGMYLRPQHFQQLERYVEHYVQHRSAAGASPFFWGLADIEIDHGALKIGKIALLSAQGVLPDGTPFSFHSGEDAPVPLDVPATLRDQRIVLAAPLRQHGAVDVIYEESQASLARYVAQNTELADNVAVSLGPAAVQLGKMRLRLMPESELGADWQGIGVVRVRERHPDNHVSLDPDYIAPMLSAIRHPVLTGLVRELHGLLEQRGALLEQRLKRSGRGSVGEVADFLLLGLVNRAQSETWHVQQAGMQHPEILFRDWLRLACDLSTFTSPTRRPVVWPVYRHDDLQSAFGPLMLELRRSLSSVMEQSAVAIELQERAQRVWVARIPTPELLRRAAFVLAVRADLPAEAVQTRYPAQVKIGPVEHLHNLVHLQLPGIGLRALPVAPRQIPYHVDHHYFELDSSSELWGQLEKSGGLALHVAGDLPGLSMECWAIRSQDR
ncbi:type VI secretion system baseplate subunit TssK [Caballeronia sp. LZ035]|uniref:type VI secretion system baseplate subunit TssK n=1 Tax=Caballeronia sp. LZ035 TaxID=3038568 RepID=UPI002859D958|nr:type VI secretion system baseplate subunit TssK [Caballeronia sp. LZ035]MDR5759519.1 type VI secretion system baseplate subunit TssK [Caballeronia sp. LZ035]